MCQKFRYFTLKLTVLWHCVVTHQQCTVSKMLQLPPAWSMHQSTSRHSLAAWTTGQFHSLFSRDISLRLALVSTSVVQWNSSFSRKINPGKDRCYHIAYQALCLAHTPPPPSLTLPPSRNRCHRICVSHTHWSVFENLILKIANSGHRKHFNISSLEKTQWKFVQSFSLHLRAFFK